MSRSGNFILGEHFRWAPTMRQGLWKVLETQSQSLLQAPARLARRTGSGPGSSNAEVTLEMIWG